MVSPSSSSSNNELQWSFSPARVSQVLRQIVYNNNNNNNNVNNNNVIVIVVVMK